MAEQGRSARSGQDKQAQEQGQQEQQGRRGGRKDVPRADTTLNVAVLADDLAGGRRTQSVEVLQRQLAAHGHYDGVIDGVPGPKTLDAYRRHSGDGTVDAEMLDKLGIDVV